MCMSLCVTSVNAVPSSRHAPGAPNAVRISVGGVGHVKIDHMRDLAHIDAAGGDVGRNQHLDLAPPEVIHGFLAAVLRQVALQRGGGQAGFLQRLGQALGAATWCG